jgi:transketolase
MIVKEQKLTTKIFLKNIEEKPTRDGFGEGIVEAAEKNNNILALTADLKDSTRLTEFAEKFPERFFDVGVAEQALVIIASGMANYGKVPFITSFAVFSPGRNWEQIRTTVCLNNVPVKIIGTHAGLNVGADGATHQALEDISLMRVLPNMTVISPCDSEEARKATIEASKTKTPVYIRLTREKFPIITTINTPFKIGRAEILWHSKSPLATIAATGPMVYESLKAAKELDKKGIEVLVINCHTIKPLDQNAILNAAKITGAVVTVEEHQTVGGLGSAVSEVLSQNFPFPIEFIGVKDSFGESGTKDELFKKHKLTKEEIIEAVKAVIVRRSS